MWCPQPAKPFVLHHIGVFSLFKRVLLVLVAKRLDCRPVCVCWERALSERLAPLFAAVIG
jgi:hypothetical protein